MILCSKVIVLADDDHSLGDDYSRQSMFSKQEVPQKCGVGRVYYQLAGGNGGYNHHFHQQIFYHGHPVVFHKVDVRAGNEHYLGISGTPCHQEEGCGGYIYHDLAQSYPPNGHHSIHSGGCNLVAEVLNYLEDWDVASVAVRDKDRSLHVVVLNIHLFHHPCRSFYP